MLSQEEKTLYMSAFANALYDAKKRAAESSYFNKEIVLLHAATEAAASLDDFRDAYDTLCSHFGNTDPILEAYCLVSGRDAGVRKSA
jgi:hypothetical protein